MGPLLLFVAGIAMLVGGRLILRSFGPGYRVGRLLAAARDVSVADALRLAGSDTARIVRVRGRVDSEHEFEDADHRPLVFRRTRVQVRRDGRWETVEDQREAVPFTVGEGLDAIRVVGAPLDAGLVVVPRDATGSAADIPDRVPPGTPSAVDRRAEGGLEPLGPRAVGNALRPDADPPRSEAAGVLPRVSRPGHAPQRGFVEPAANSFAGRIEHQFHFALFI